MQRIEQKRRTRQRVVDAATHLFSVRGLARTRTADIANQAGLSHGGVFVHFPSRDELLAEVVSEIGQAITGRLHALIIDDAELVQVLRAHLDCLIEHEPSYAAFLRESRLLPRNVLRTWVGIQSAISIHLEVPAQEAMAAKRIHEMPLHLLFNTWIGLIHHYLMNRELFAPGASVLERRGDELLAHFLSMISLNRPYDLQSTEW